jgi:uncharacterized protein (DUF2062 family)
MTASQPKICVVVPTYNNVATIAEVVRDVCAAGLELIVVNDGSTDGTAAALAALPGVDVLTQDVNRGKGVALLRGFEHAAGRGFTHAVTMDGDNQHFAADLPKFVAAVQAEPEALIVGVRDLRGLGPKRKSRWLRANSNFWVRVETGQWVADTQSGFRAYPLRPILALALNTRRYDFEIESLVKAMWCGVPVRGVDIAVQYDPRSHSHFRPLHDFALVSLLNSRLVARGLLLPLPLLRVVYLRDFARQSWSARALNTIRLGFGADSPGTFSRAVGLGVLCGILPIWGLQGATACLLAHLFRLSKATAFLASNISFPVALPFVLYASVLAGQLTLTGSVDPRLRFSEITLRTVGHEAWTYLVGSVVLAVGASVASSVLAYGLARALFGIRRPGV